MKLLKEISMIEINYSNTIINFTVSCGICKITEDDNIESAIKNADLAMYEVKKSGKNSIKFHK